MNNAEAEDVYQKLTMIISDLGWSWVVRQIEDQIRLGRLEETIIESEVNSPSTDLSSSRRPGSKVRPRKSRVAMTKRMEYLPKERLRLLATSIEQAIIAAAEMEQETLRNLPYVQKLEFRPEEQGETMRLIRDDSHGRITVLEQTKKFLKELKEAIDAN
ncbi:hypothetical protein [Myxococcus stipitatus]|uniref:hypothetical protein n=1 Tax=Myxococcus stipitatus TaxID=83455 RepID=UPI001184EAE8|nr:hypothetical protein [Myxococcus stipitatus]